MTVRELIEQLSNLNLDAIVTVSVGDPKDTAFSDDLSLRVDIEDSTVDIGGWVASDNENACAPWRYRDD